MAPGRRAGLTFGATMPVPSELTDRVPRSPSGPRRSTPASLVAFAARTDIVAPAARVGSRSRGRRQRSRVRRSSRVSRARAPPDRAAHPTLVPGPRPSRQPDQRGSHLCQLDNCGPGAGDPLESTQPALKHRRGGRLFRSDPLGTGRPDERLVPGRIPGRRHRPVEGVGLDVEHRGAVERVDAPDREDPALP